MKEEKIVIGQSDFTRQQIEQGVHGWGSSSEQFMSRIRMYEKEGYTVKFETSFWRRIFALGIYKVVAYKNK